ncbi:PreQ(1) synthase [Saliniradius amylolyticus]|uniref:NADPH-dependent 7-cyano-7-deazaguanine reductase n=1 Tax=Saliniradius amylolyticus TaxID=2183582 RepID=A0A2S2E6M7_9ALTE|nr:NADPH-dependent 7-cyano-7-deazaguanine reductase QueF [Saliniradius amylolyticus]AWL12627.1 PreQ(1) synthase [Saliniradius amylolyticus]
MTQDQHPDALKHLSLGQETNYNSGYDPELLQAVPRRLNREDIGLTGVMPFKGVDIWNGYELSWLNTKGKPCVGILEARVPFNSPNLIESKSFKLYLNSLNQYRLPSTEALQQHLERDLSACAQAPVTARIHPLNAPQYQVSSWQGDCLDDLDISMDDYQYDPSLLTCSDDKVSETLISHLLKSNCLITNQPDWGSVMIRYQGSRIKRENLLTYLITFRQHNEFHEQCVERIYCDIMRHCKPEKLTVYARYTRRGGLDINPFRSNFESEPDNQRLTRQ